MFSQVILASIRCNFNSAKVYFVRCIPLPLFKLALPCLPGVALPGGYNICNKFVMFLKRRQSVDKQTFPAKKLWIYRKVIHNSVDKNRHIMFKAAENRASLWINWSVENNGRYRSITYIFRNITKLLQGPCYRPQTWLRFAAFIYAAPLHAALWPLLKGNYSCART